jgi:hypothetical protein
MQAVSTPDLKAELRRRRAAISDESFNDAFDPNSPLAEQVPCPRACLQPSMRMH